MAYDISFTCDDCGNTVEEFDEETGYYILKNGEIVDTTKHQF